MTIILIFPYQIVTLRYKWWVENTYLHSLLYEQLNHSVLMKWYDSPKMYYDYCSWENTQDSAALSPIMIRIYLFS